MQITIHVDTTVELSENDKAVLLALAGPNGHAENAWLPKQPETAAEPEPEAPRKRRTRKAAEPTPEAAEPTPEAEVETTPEPEPEEDLVGGGPTLEDAVSRATALVSDGKASDVKAALAKFGARRVSELKPNQIADFLAALP